MNPEVDKIPIPKDASLDGKVLLRLWLEKYDIGLDIKDYELLGLKITGALVDAYRSGLGRVFDAIDEHIQSLMATKVEQLKQAKKKPKKKTTKKKKVAKKKAKKKKLTLSQKLPSTDDL